MAKSREHISDLKTDSRALQQDVARLSKQAAYQKLLIQGMWELLAEKLEIEDSELLKRIGELEQCEDDVEAGKCPQCDRYLQDNSTMCLYCGTVVGRTSLF